MLTRDNYINSPLEIKDELLYFLNKDEKLVVFDIGACEAEDSIRYSNLFPKAVVYAFEPRKDNFQKAKELIKQYNKSEIILENIALSDQKGKATFYVSSGEPENLKNDENWDYGNKSSSLLPPSEEMKKHTSWLTFKEEIEVDTERLDRYAEDHQIKQIDFMHLDVQGGEMMVLNGAGQLISKVKLIWMEVENVALYQDQPLKKDIETFMREHQFINVLDTVDSVSGDQLYINSVLIEKSTIENFIAARKPGIINRIKSFFKSR